MTVIDVMSLAVVVIIFVECLSIKYAIDIEIFGEIKGPKQSPITHKHIFIFIFSVSVAVLALTLVIVIVILAVIFVLGISFLSFISDLFLYFLTFLLLPITNAQCLLMLSKMLRS